MGGAVEGRWVGGRGGGSLKVSRWRTVLGASAWFTIAFDLLSEVA